MFRIRDRKTEAIAKRGEPKVEISATHDLLPLKHVDWLERWCTLPSGFRSAFEPVFNFEVRADDVFLTTFMKSGTTWMQEAAWLLLNGVDFDQANSEDLVYRSPYLESAGFDVEAQQKMRDAFDRPSGPRLIKTHLPVNLLPKQLWQKKAKVIFLARNVKDVVMSAFYFMQKINFWRGGTLDDFMQDFMHDELMFTPFWPRLLDFWQLRHEPHVFFVTYEEMSRDVAGVLQRLCGFLERPDLSEAQLQQLTHHLSFQSMKENKRTNLRHAISRVEEFNNPNFEFMRRGIAGAYKDEMTAEQQGKLDAWSAGFLSPLGLTERDIFGEI